MTEPQIIYEDKNFLGVSKPSGMLTHRARVSADKMQMNADSVGANQRSNLREPAALTDWLIKKYPEIRSVGDDPETRPGIVHRLDKETSGVLVVPRNQEYFEYFKNLFKTRQIRKMYLAIVRGEPKEKRGIIDKPIGIKNGTVKRSIHSPKMAKPAITEYKVIKTFVSGGVPLSLLEVYPRTGRTHQIRVHLASIGHSIIGDSLYGGKKNKELAERTMLHAYSLEFFLPAPAGAGRQAGLPNGSRIKLEAEPDDSFQVL